ncbi:hypothetical protein GQX74_005794 [Glossina fuscipes]|nr:hypothetical protein GQX74_005794 [Glossina fuscipes]
MSEYQVLSEHNARDRNCSKNIIERSESYNSFIEAKKQFYNTVKEAKFIQRIKTINDICKSGNSKTFSKFIKAHHRVPHKGILWNSDNNIAYLNLLKNSITANNAAIATHIPSSHYRSKCISDMSSKNRQMRQRLMLLMRKRRRTNLNSIMTFKLTTELRYALVV